MRTNAVLAAIILCFLGWHSSRAAAQPDVDGGLPTWVTSDPFTERNNDPLSAGQENLERITPTEPDELIQPPIPVRYGETLSAIAGVRETSHEISIELEAGLALVKTRIRFLSTANVAAEVRYRIATPPNVTLASLRVSNATGTRNGTFHSTTHDFNAYDNAVRVRANVEQPLPVADAILTHDSRGDAIYLRIAPLQRGIPLDAELQYLVPTETHGGTTRLTLPGRGEDLRTVPAEIRVHASQLSGATVDGQDAVEQAVLRESDRAYEIAASLPSGSGNDTTAWSFPCGNQRCAHIHVGLANARASRAPLFILLDVSPSMRGPTQGRIMPTVQALASLLPNRTPVGVVLFAANANRVADALQPANTFQWEVIHEELDSALGNATHLYAGLRQLEPWLREYPRARIVIISDGGWTESPRSQRRLRQAHQHGAQVTLVNISDKTTSPNFRAVLEPNRGRILQLNREAEHAARSNDLDALSDALRAIVTPGSQRIEIRTGQRIHRLGTLSPGDALRFTHPIGRNLRIVPFAAAQLTPAPEAWVTALQEYVHARAQEIPRMLLALTSQDRETSPNTCSVTAPLRSQSASVPRDSRLALADARSCRGTREYLNAPPATAPAQRRSVPEQAILHMLRQRLVPAARACFRSDRRGRRNYQMRATYELALADREITELRIRGRFSRHLRRCLASTTDRLDIPPFDGTIRIRYPLYTDRAAPEPTLQLRTDVADAIDALAPNETEALPPPSRHQSAPPSSDD